MAFIHSGDHVFFIIEKPDYEYDEDCNKIETDEVYIKCLSLKEISVPCVCLSLSKKKQKTYAELSLLYSHTSCSLEQDTNVVYMLQTILTYVLESYPYITSIEVQDDTLINVPGKPLITARRLLLGQKGWYEEHLGAIPREDRIRYRLNFIRHPMIQPRVRALVPPETVENPHWWSPERIAVIADQVNTDILMYIIGSKWTISAATIKKYGIQMKIIPATMEETAVYEEKIHRVQRDAPFSYVSFHWIRERETPSA